MYLAHHLLTLGHQFHSTLPPDVSATFVDLIPEIRALGTTSFLDQMNMQKAIIEKYLQAAGGNFNIFSFRINHFMIRVIDTLVTL